MLLSAFAVLAILGASQAKPAPKVLEFDDVLILRDDGDHVVMKKWDYQIEEDKRQLQARRQPAEIRQPPATSPAAKIQERCEQSREVQVLTDSNFNDWDVAMSPVIGNIGSTAATVSVSKGYSISDTVTVSASVGVTLLEGILSASLDVSTTNTYTTTDTQTFTFNVPNGQYGLVVSNPYVHRLTGNVFSGCTDSPTIDPFQTSEYTSQAFGSLEWVKGPIVMCNSTMYPIPYCVGPGEHT